MSKVLITLGNYVDSVDVFLDERKLKVKKLSATGKATFECSTDCGLHTLSVVKQSKMLEKGWGRNVFFHWLSLLSGTPDWTISEVKKDGYTCSFSAEVNVKKDEQICLLLSESGIEVLEASAAVEILGKEYKEQPVAKNRVRRAFLWPAYILMAVICLAILAMGIYMAIAGNLIALMVAICILFFLLWIFFVYAPKHQ